MAEQDIKENEMTPVSRVDYVRGIKGKDSVLITPNELLSAMFQDRGDASPNDFNDNLLGVSAINDSNSKANNNPNISYGLLLTFKSGSYWGQMAIHINATTFKFRTRNNIGNWTEWRSVTLT